MRKKRLLKLSLFGSISGFYIRDKMSPAQKVSIQFLIFQRLFAQFIFPALKCIDELTAVF